LRKDSKTFGKHFKIILSDNNAKSLFIPAGFAHGFLGLKKENIIYYYCTNYRSAKHETGILWNDKKLNIKWPIKKPIISLKDKKNLTFSEFKNLF
jgi:dTDP-4-dehydrorhamnose 3,5-epimerase